MPRDAGARGSQTRRGTRTHCLKRAALNIFFSGLNWFYTNTFGGAQGEHSEVFLAPLHILIENSAEEFASNGSRVGPHMGALSDDVRLT